MVPILLKPRVLGLKNKILKHTSLKQGLGREVVVIVLSVLIIAVMYAGSLSFFDNLQAIYTYVAIEPKIIISLFLSGIFFLLLVSNSIAAISVLFMGKDLDRILAAPVSSMSIYVAKSVEILQSSCWMVCVFAAPTLLAFLQSYSFNLIEIGLATFIILLFITIPLVWSVGIAIILSSIFAVHRVRRVLFMIAIVALAAIYGLIQIVGGASPGHDRFAVITNLITYTSHPLYHYLPSHWAGVALGELASKEQSSFWNYLLALFFLTVGSIATVYLLIDFLYHKTFSACNTGFKRYRINSKSAQNLSSKLLAFCSPVTRALINKELKCFTRDMSQALQLIMLIGLCMLYLYNFNAVSVASEHSNSSVSWSGPVLFLINILMGSFVTTAICSRFVFPSISLEGRSLWLLLSAPMDLNELLIKKIQLWFYPIALISAVILTSGSLAVNSPLPLVICTFFISLLTTLTVVALAISLGTIFSQFDWENSAQLSANFGSMVFMLTSMGLIIFSLIPLAIALVSYYAIRFESLNHWLLGWPMIILTLVIYTCMHILAIRWSKKTGLSAMKRLKY